MSEDTISRKAVVDICNNAIDLWHGQLGEGIVIAVKKKIKELPSAQPEPQWIPCSERAVSGCRINQTYTRLPTMMEELSDTFTTTMNLVGNTENDAQRHGCHYQNCTRNGVRYE